MEALNSILAAIKPALVGAVYAVLAMYASALAGKLFGKVVEWLIATKARINETKYGAMTQLDDYLFDAAIDAAQSTKSEVVDALKAKSADGKLTKEEMAEVKEIAYQTIMASLPADIKDELLRVAKDDAKAYVMAMIPSAVEFVKGLQNNSGMGGSPSLDALGAKIDSAIKDASDPQ